MNFLSICKRVNDVVGFQGIVSSVSPTGYQKVLINAVKDAWDDIQRERSDWDFMRRTKQVNVGTTANVYTLDDLWGVDTHNLAEWIGIKYNYTSLMQVTYDYYEMMDFSSSNGGKPNLYAIEPDTKSLLISPVDQVYTLDIYYIKTLQALSLNADIPSLPTRFHQAIVYGAVMKLSTFVGNITLYDTYSAQYARILGQLMREENPAKWVRKRPIA